jgi:4-amino-4-deoxy-L-arabinose transferase-like glycosyltransferase
VRIDVVSHLGDMLEAMGRSRGCWLALFVAAIVVRLVFAIVAPHLGIFDGSDESSMVVARGSDGYDSIARHLLRGDGYRIRADIAPTMMRNPGYVAVVAAAFAVFGDHWIVGVLLQGLVSAMVVVLIGRVGGPVVGSGSAFLAAALYVGYPADWLACARYIVEPMCGLLILVTLLALRWWMNRASAVAGALLGLAVGAMALTRSVAVYLLPFLLMWMVVFLPDVRRRVRALVRPAAMALIVSAAVLLPWGWYNYARSGHWIFTSTVVGWAFFDRQYANDQSDRDVSRAQLWLE